MFLDCMFSVKINGKLSESNSGKIKNVKIQSKEDIRWKFDDPGAVKL